MDFRCPLNHTGSPYDNQTAVGQYTSQNYLTSKTIPKSNLQSQSKQEHGERQGQKGDIPKSNSRPETPELGPADVRTIQSLKNNHLQMHSTQSLALPTHSSYERPGCHRKNTHFGSCLQKKMHILVPVYDSWTHSMRIHFSCL